MVDGVALLPPQNSGRARAQWAVGWLSTITAMAPWSPAFDKFARSTEYQVGRPTAFALAFLVVILWAVTGPLFGWSDTWQLVINTGTTIVTFLMVFVIQNTQSRDTRALQLKLDELIRVNTAARNSLISLEEKPESQVEQIKSDLGELAGNPRRL
jgi:low affinity Fe/Cu permease